MDVWSWRTESTDGLEAQSKWWQKTKFSIHVSYAVEMTVFDFVQGWMEFSLG